MQSVSSSSSDVANQFLKFQLESKLDSASLIKVTITRQANPLECASECVVDGCCKSFSYASETGHCTLHTTEMAEGVTTEPDDKYDVWQKMTAV